MKATKTVVLSALFALVITSVSAAQEMALIGSSIGSVETSATLDHNTLALANTRRQGLLSDVADDAYFEPNLDEEETVPVVEAKSNVADYIFFATLSSVAGLGMLISATCFYRQRYPSVPKLML